MELQSAELAVFSLVRKFFDFVSAARGFRHPPEERTKLINGIKELVFKYNRRYQDDKLFIFLLTTFTVHNMLPMPTTFVSKGPDSLFPAWYNEYRDKMSFSLGFNRDSAQWRDLQGNFFASLDLKIDDMIGWAKAISPHPLYTVWNALHFRPLHLADRETFVVLVKGLTSVDYTATFFSRIGADSPMPVNAGRSVDEKKVPIHSASNVVQKRLDVSFTKSPWEESSWKESLRPNVQPGTLVKRKREEAIPPPNKRPFVDTRAHPVESWVESVRTKHSAGGRLVGGPLTLRLQEERVQPTRSVVELGVVTSYILSNIVEEYSLLTFAIASKTLLRAVLVHCRDRPLLLCSSFRLCRLVQLGHLEYDLCGPPQVMALDNTFLGLVSARHDSNEFSKRLKRCVSSVKLLVFNGLDISGILATSLATFHLATALSFHRCCLSVKLETMLSCLKLHRPGLVALSVSNCQQDLCLLPSALTSLKSCSVQCPAPNILESWPWEKMGYLEHLEIIPGAMFRLDHHQAEWIVGKVVRCMPKIKSLTIPVAQNQGGLIDLLKLRELTHLQLVGTQGSINLVHLDRCVLASLQKLSSLCLVDCTFRKRCAFDDARCGHTAVLARRTLFSGYHSGSTWEQMARHFARVLLSRSHSHLRVAVRPQMFYRLEILAEILAILQVAEVPALFNGVWLYTSTSPFLLFEPKGKDSSMWVHSGPGSRVRWKAAEGRWDPGISLGERRCEQYPVDLAPEPLKGDFAADKEFSFCFYLL